MVRWKLSGAALLLLGAAAAGQMLPAPTRAINSATPLSERVVAYTISAKLNTKDKTIDATEVLAYRNLTGQPQDTFPFHMYLNAFRPESTQATEIHAGGTRDAVADWNNPKTLGSIDISQMTVDGMGDVTSQMQYTAPDDGNLLDHTVMQVHLPRPAAPGETVTFRMNFHDKLPESGGRNGWKRDFFMGAQWFPKVGVWWKGAWNCHQFHANTEFFADFGTYDVKLTLPKRYIVGSSGVQLGEQQNSDGTKTLVLHGEDIHDFAWAASPRFTETDRIFQGQMGPVRLRALVLEVHKGQRERYLDCLQGTMGKFEDWYGPYPYTQITLIDPEPDSGMEGMEYPTLFTAGTVAGIPEWIHLPELVTEHEYGHQYWYGMVATNEFEEAWLDEGINSYTEQKILGSLYGANTSVLNAKTAYMSDTSLQRTSYLGQKDWTPIATPAWKFASNGDYGAVTYGKTATVLQTLANIVGEDVMNRAMRTYFMTYRFKHPTGTDFLNTVKQVINRPDLDSFFDQAIYRTAVLDYAIDDVDSVPNHWWKRSSDCRQGCVDTVTVRRKGDFILPVTVEVRFSDGSSQRAQWDGTARWTRMEFAKNASIVSATVDPDHKILLDANYFNNSFQVDAAPLAARKLSGYWWFGHQLLAQLMAFFS